LFDFELGTSQIIDVTAQSERRGYFQPEFLLLESIFPMGLLKCWTWLRFDTKAIIYPVPMMCGFPQSRLEKQDDDGGEGLMIKGDDFYGFSQYQAGDSIKHIAWSLYAREQGLQTKQYVASVSQDIWLKWSDFYRGDTEVCLSNMCYWAMQFHKQFQPFGLDIANNKIPISVGDSHLTQVLIALALYPGGDVKA
jgi:uncharacterized protein (DUF58 family)